jgi:CubicO group peptidase (beta-lactamase class C family)
MKNIIMAFLFLLWLQPVTAQNIQRLDKSKISTAQLTSRIIQMMDSAKVTGMVVAVLNHNQPVYTKAFGYANTDKQQQMDISTSFWACSFSKAVFGYCVMKLTEKNIIHLDTPLVRYLKKPLYEYAFSNGDKDIYKDLKGDKRYEKITARMCLDHTTGFPNTREETGGVLRIAFEPGTHYSYSGEGMFLLQMVLEEITGKSYETLVQEEVLRPLRMTHTSYVWQPAFEKNYCVGHDLLQHPYPFMKRTFAAAAGSMQTTIGDYSRFFTALLTRQGLSSKSFNEMLRPQIPILSVQQFRPFTLDKNPQTTSLFYGLGVGLLKTPYGTAFFKEGHFDGWGHYSIGFPDRGIAIIIMTNSDYGESIFKPLLETAIGDVYTPWYWENYITYNMNPA